MSPSRFSSPSKCAFRPLHLVLFLSLLTVSFALGLPIQFGASATNRSVAPGANDARVDSAGRTASFAGAPAAPAAADPNTTLIYSQLYDGQSGESSSKIQGETQYDREAADDFDLNATITRVLVRGSRGGYNMPPNPVYYGVYVRFYDGTQGTPGALQVEHYLPAGTPGVIFDAARPNSFDITLPAAFNANGKHFLSVQPVFGGSETWGVSSSNYQNVRGSALVKRDRLANEAWAVGGIAGRLYDMSFDLFGTNLSTPRIDQVTPNPVPRSGLVRISGAHFGARDDGQLTIDGQPSQYIAQWADNLIVAYVPETSALGNVPVSITTNGKTGTAMLNVTTRPAAGRIRWQFTVAAGHVPRRSTLGPDGTVYVNDVKGRLYALTPDGGLKWVFQAGFVSANGPVSVGADGTIYVGGLVPKNPATACEANQYTVNVEGIFALRPDGTQKWLFDKTCDGLLSGPNVGPDGNIHAVTDTTGIGAFALQPDGTLAHAPTGRFGVDGEQGTEIVFGPAEPGQSPTQKYFQYESSGLFGYTLDGQRVFLYPTNAVGIAQPVVGQRTGTVYTTPDHQTASRFFAVSPQGALRWVSPIRPISSLSIPDAPPSESAVYIRQDGVKLHRVNPEDGSVVWTFNDNNEQLFDPIASPDDRLVLMGGQANYNQPGFFEAVSSDGRQLWKQHLPDEPGLSPYGQVVPRYRARFTADGQTAYIAAHVSGADYSATIPAYSFFYALDTSDNNNAPINQPPKATVTSPLDNTDSPVNTEINITARVVDDGQIERVEFYYLHNGNRTAIGSDTTPDADGTYRSKFTPTQTGGHSIFAVAYDVGGLRGDSTAALVWVTDRRPMVSWVSPADGASFAAPASIALVARATDPDGKVVGVEFKTYQTGVVGYNVIGSDTTPDANGNYQLDWAHPPQGTYEITATAIDNSGLSQGAPITITIAPASTPIYTIGGTVRDQGGQPMSGVDVTLGSSTPATATTGADGTYLFSDLKGGSNYAVTPSRAGYSFTPAQHVFNSLAENQTANFNGARNSYAVRGQIKDTHNVGMREVAITVSGGQATTFYTDANGNYSFNLPAGGSYTLTPSLVNYTFQPASQSFANLSADQTASFNGTLNTHGISGRVLENGYTRSGVTVTLTGSQTGTATTDPSGYFSFNLPAGGTYTVTPSLSGYTFSPASLTFGNLSGNVSGSFTATSTNQLPRVTVTSPANNATFVAPATLTINADASDPDGTVSKVEFYAEYRSGAFHFQTIHLGTDTTAPYTATFSYAGADTFVVRAAATDDRGGRNFSESSFVTFTLDAPRQTPGWHKQFSSTRPEMNGSPYEVMGFSAVDGRHAWASHINAKVSYTTDGGLTWNTVPVAIDGGNNNHAQDVDFVDTQTGWVVGGEDNAVLRSTDGGRTYVRQPTGLGASLFGVDAVDTNTVFAVGSTYAAADGSGPVVLRTRDGGATWTEISHPFRHHTRASYYAVHFINQTTGWIAGSSGNVIKTTNGGSTWTDVSVPTELPLSDISFADANNGWTVGYGGVIFRTTDGGATWQQQNAGTSEAILSVSAVSPTVAWIGCYGSTGFVARTTDAGVTWHREYPEVTDTIGSYSTVFFFNAENGWTAGHSGIFRRGAAQSEPATYTISGRLTDARGAALPGASVTLSGSQSATTQTGADGSYSFTRLPGGTFTVTPGMSSFSFNPVLTTFNNLAADQTANFVGALNTHSIGGQIKDNHNVALAGVTVALSGGQSATATTDTNGHYSFAGVAAGGNYMLTPSLVNHGFNPVNLSFDNLNANQAANFTGTRNTFSIVGRVAENGNALAAVTVTLSGSQTAATTTDTNGNYSFNLPAGGNYTVTPSRTHYTFAPPSLSFNNLSSNQTANFNAARNTHSISGQIKDGDNVALSGATVTLSGSQSATATTDAAGNYSFASLPAGGSYTLTPAASFFNFNPAEITFADLGSNRTADFTGARSLITISGRVSDAVGNGLDGATMTLSGARAATVQTDANGQYVLRDLPAGGDFVVTPAKAGYTFNPANSSLANLATSATADFIAIPNTASVQFGAAGFVQGEGGGRITLTVTRSGNMAGTVSVAYATTDNPAAVRCDDNTTMPGMAFARCDYATSVDRISFAPGESSATLTIPLVDDSHPENDEMVEVRLSEPAGATLGNQTTARFTITDNDDPNAPNALDGNEFFVRMQYLDFLNREPDAEGKAAWERVLDNCLNGDPACDRNTVSSSFFRSKEFQLKGYFVYLFYKVALNRLPRYVEITPDMRSVSGQTGEEVYRKRAEFAAQFIERAAFREQYDALSDQAFVNTLLNRYNLTAITTRHPANPEATERVTLTSAQLLSQLSAGTLSRAQVLRAIVESDEVAAVEYNGAFVAMQYFGYLRRDPEADGYKAWLRVLDANPGDYRTMVHGFESSVEYRLRFGKP